MGLSVDCFRVKHGKWKYAYGFRFESYSDKRVCSRSGKLCVCVCVCVCVCAYVRACEGCAQIRWDVFGVIYVVVVWGAERAGGKFLLMFDSVLVRRC